MVVCGNLKVCGRSPPPEPSCVGNQSELPLLLLLPEGEVSMQAKVCVWEAMEREQGRQAWKAERERWKQERNSRKEQRKMFQGME